jgi:hypothetical protein
MSRRKKSNQSSIARLLPSLVQDKGWEKQLDLHSIFPKWRDIVGKEMSEYAQPLKVERGVLWLEVENSAWLQQLQYEKLELLDSLNRFLKLASLSDIKMVLPKGGDRTPARKPPPEVSFVRPSEEKVAAFQQQVACITDEKCREALMQFWYLAQACKRKNAKKKK